jgi:hypothetical protein
MLKWVVGDIKRVVFVRFYGYLMGLAWRRLGLAENQVGT